MHRGAGTMIDRYTHALVRRNYRRGTKPPMTQAIRIKSHGDYTTEINHVGSFASDRADSNRKVFLFNTPL